MIETHTDTCKSCGSLFLSKPRLLQIVEGEMVGTSYFQRCDQCLEKAKQKNLRLYPICLMCGTQYPTREGIRGFYGHPNDTIHIACKSCEPQLLALPMADQWQIARRACEVTYPSPQFVYALVCPVTKQSRSIGRTHNLKTRLAQHMRDSPSVADENPITNHQWIGDLKYKGLKPEIHIIEEIQPSPLVVERELRHILNAIQKGHDVLNIENTNSAFIAQRDMYSVSYADKIEAEHTAKIQAIRSTSINFLDDPYSEDMQKLFSGSFLSHQIPFIRACYQ